MRAVMLEVPFSLIEERRRLGLDRWDEVWEGELHMVPPPTPDHQSLNDQLGTFFSLHWRDLGRTWPETGPSAQLGIGVKRPGTTVVPELRGAPSDYRMPDRCFLRVERLDRAKGDWIVGGPDAVLEIVAPGDESRAKLPFWLSLGVREVILIDRDTRDVELLRAGTDGWRRVEPAHDGWLPSEALQVEIRRELGPAARAVLHLRRADDPGRDLRVGC